MGLHFVLSAAEGPVELQEMVTADSRSLDLGAGLDLRSEPSAKSTTVKQEQATCDPPFLVSLLLVGHCGQFLYLL